MSKQKGKNILLLFGKVIGRLALFILGIFGILFFTIAVLIARYRQWERQELDFLSQISNQEYSNIEKDTIEKELTEFQTSRVEKENLRLTRDDFEILLIKSFNEGGNNDIEAVEMVTLNRAFDIYIKTEGFPWMVVRVWQRQEGVPDFAVFDVKVGPISLSKLSWGWISSEFSKGVGDAMDLVLSDSFGGRKISELYIFENGIRIVGVIYKE
ncbi:MAG: hypothetical protein ABIC57_04210 [bacterium]